MKNRLYVALLSEIWGDITKNIIIFVSLFIYYYLCSQILIYRVMNIIFMDPEYVRHDAWRYIVSVLKIRKVICFIDSKEFPLGTFGTAEVQFRNQTPESRKDIVYGLANQMKRRILSPDGDFLGHEDLDLYKESHWNKPKTNIRETNDSNILILGNIYTKFRGPSIFEETITCADDDYIFIPNPEDDYTEDRDVALNMILYLFKILFKQLGTDKYKERICCYMMDFVAQRDFYMGEACWKRVWDKKNHFIKFINSLLLKQYPNIFPIIDNNGKKCYTSIFNKDVLDQARQEWIDYCKECREEERIEEERFNREREEMQSSYDWDAEVREINREFWNECGEAGSNCESWPGWD